MRRAWQGAAVLLMSAFVLATMAGAQERSLKYDGNTLLKALEEEQPTYAKGMARGYVNGVASFRSVFCSPSGVTDEQLWEVVRRHLRDHPEDRRETPSVHVMEAIESAWPCLVDNPR
jgi:Ssp1 endopeptidase immunity protein Rap1a